MSHLTQEELERYAANEIECPPHVEECARCAAAALQIMQMKIAIRDAMSVEGSSQEFRRRVLSRERRPARPWLAAAAALLLITAAAVIAVRARRSPALPELVDMHVTMLASANPVDVLSTDRHTVRPWFEGRLPFSVPVPELAETPFHLIGGRVVYWRANPGAYLLVGKGAHRISLFVFRDDLAPRDLYGSADAISTMTWRSGGLTFVAVGQVPQEDLRMLADVFRARKTK